MTVVVTRGLRRLVDVEDLRVLVAAGQAVGVHVRSRRCDVAVIDEAYVKRIEDAVARLTCPACRGRQKRRDASGDLFELCGACGGIGLAP